MNLPKWLKKTETDRRQAGEVLLNNLDVVEEILREDLGIGVCEPQKDNRYVMTEYSAGELVNMVSQIEKYKNEVLKFSGYPVVAVEGIMYYYQDKIQRVLDASGLTPAEQEKHLLEPIITLIRIIHLLPATNNYHHTKLGGLIEHSLECAYYAAEIAESEIWPMEDSYGSIPKSRWITGAIICGLYHDLWKIATDVSIADASGQKMYSAWTLALIDWAFESIGSGNNYYATWGKNCTESHDRLLTSVLMMNHGLLLGTRSWLCNEVVKDLGNFLCLPFESRFKGVVIRANRKSIKHDRRYPPHQDPQEENIELIFEAIKRMLSYGNDYIEENYEPKEFEIGNLKIRGWAINTPTSAVIYHDRDHLFLFWDDFKQLAVEDKLLNLRNPFFHCLDNEENEFYALTQELMDRGYLHSYGESKYWDVRRVNPETLEPYPEKLKAICFNEAGIDVIFRYVERPPVNGNLISISEKGFVNEPVGTEGSTTSEVNLSDVAIKESEKEVNQPGQETITQEQADSFLPDFDSLLSKGLKPEDPESK